MYSFYNPTKIPTKFGKNNIKILTKLIKKLSKNKIIVLKLTFCVITSADVTKDLSKKNVTL